MISVDLSKDHLKQISKGESKGAKIKLTHKQLQGDRVLYVDTTEQEKVNIALLTRKPATIHLSPSMIRLNIEKGNLNDLDVKKGGFLPLAALIPMIAGAATALAGGTAAAKNIRDLVRGNGLFNNNQEAILQNLLIGLNALSNGATLNPMAAIPLLTGTVLAGTEAYKGYKRGSSLPNSRLKVKANSKLRPLSKPRKTRYVVKTGAGAKKKSSTKTKSKSKSKVKTKSKSKSKSKSKTTKTVKPKRTPKKKPSRKPKKTMMTDTMGSSLASHRMGGSMIGHRAGYGLNPAHYRGP